MNITFKKLITPNPEIATVLNKWVNDPLLVAFIRPCKNQTELEEYMPVTVELLTKHLQHQQSYLIYLESQLIGKMDYQMDFENLFKKETDTAWIGIAIGEKSSRGKGIGTMAMEYLEKEIQTQGIRRIELGVFGFNTAALKLYKRMGYQEIGRIENFAYWQGKMWSSIHMDKYLE